ncbi:MAG: hypothetical protein EP307_11065 [Rhodobacteraceae bacterium]|nr:MAG: hypothetical protein EP307_11065 [Paracoccaceae bacterium]
MLIFSAQNLAFLAVPKTGTTALEMALRRKADIVFSKHRKHMTAARFHNKVAPFLADAFDLTPERIAVMRDPVDQIGSWYRYRLSDEVAGTPRSTRGIGFDRFVLDVISDDPPPHAGIGSQFNFLTDGDGRVLVHRLFAYERQPQFRAFLEDRFGEGLDIPVKNVSPQAPTPLSAEVLARLRAARAQEFALYDSIVAAGGMLETDLETGLGTGRPA